MNIVVTMAVFSNKGELINCFPIFAASRPPTENDLKIVKNISPEGDFRIYLMDGQHIISSDYSSRTVDDVIEKSTEMWKMREVDRNGTSTC